jgi:sporulation protein YlmC with PRC-barrel domain
VRQEPTPFSSVKLAYQRQKELAMRSPLLIGGLLASVMLGPAFAQSNPPATDRPVATTETQVHTQGEVWRASKLKGLNVYNDQNEKLGDINELLIDKSGNVNGVILGIGGFLGMGEHDIRVEMSKLKFVDEPVRTSATTTTTTTTRERPASTATTTGERPAATTANTTRNKWYPDHAVFSGVTKDQLKAMPQFKYD